MVEVAILSPCNIEFLRDETKRKGAETVACVNMAFISPFAFHHVILKAFVLGVVRLFF